MRQGDLTKGSVFRAIGKPAMSLGLTVISLGTRVALAYLLSSVASIGVVGIWWAIPVGWFLADTVGVGYMIVKRKDFFIWYNIVPAS